MTERLKLGRRCLMDIWNHMPMLTGRIDRWLYRYLMADIRYRRETG